MNPTAKTPSFELSGEAVAPGTQQQISLPAARLYTDTDVDIVVNVIHGRRPGPVLLVCAASHGDEINGVEICRRLLGQRQLRNLSGTLLVVPIVNMFGFIQQTRYLPDRRDLNRCFPGSASGSLGSRLAHTIRTNLLQVCTHAIELHTGAVHRSNLPQIRADLSDTSAQAMAKAFAVPVIIDASLREGSMRECAHSMGVPLIVFEAGEALRFDPTSIKAGVRGVIGVMRHLQMLKPSTRSHRVQPPVVATDSRWTRAEIEGMVVQKAKLGEHVQAGQVIAKLASPFSSEVTEITANNDGIIIGASQLPLLHEGEALLHIAEFKKVAEVARHIEQFQEGFDDDSEAGFSTS